ncbi:MAG TPA: metallopeptidase TldD-related protein [Mycobacteriales bacterium]|jgi:predicted Zn-dependent protease|nr:metallopeptidase TldD-related protein [Mycobacteriales bacterium]
MTPQETVERALGLSKADGCIVVTTERSEANLRWAGNTLTTNGSMRSRKVAVISVVDGATGTAAGVVERSAVTGDGLEELVRASEQAARDAGPADDAAPLVEPTDAADNWEAGPEETSIDVFGQVAPALGEAFGRAAAAQRLLFGFAEHVLETRYVGSSTGVRRRWVQPTGRIDVNGKSPDFGRSAWVGRSTRDFADIDIAALDAELAERLGWAARSVELPPGRYETILPPTSVADLMFYLYVSAGARDADDGRTVFSKAGGGTRIGERLSSTPITLRSNPAEPGLEAEPFVTATASFGGLQSVFDNGHPVTPTDWIRSGELAELIRTRAWAARTDARPAPMADNLILEVPDATAGLPDMIARTERGLLLTCLWYIREVDPQTLLLTGLTRDGVYLVEGGEVTGAVNNFRWNESPVDLLGRLTEVGRTERCLPREWSDYFTRTAMPALRVPDFNMSTVSQAS